MNLTGLPNIDLSSLKHDHSFVFDAHNHDRKQLITRYRGTAVERTKLGIVVTGWQKSIYHFGGLNREVPIMVSLLLDKTGKIRRIKIDGQSKGSQGRRCDFSCLEALCGEKLTGVNLTELGSRISSAQDVKCLHLDEILSACASFCAVLAAQGIPDGIVQEYTAISPDQNGLYAASEHEVLGKRDSMHIRLDHRTPPHLNSENLTVDGLTLYGNYGFDGAKNVTIRNSKLLTKDAFWNSRNVTVIDSFISGEYLGWNSENLTLIGCTVESNQGMCYIDGLKMTGCKLINTTLAFEYSTVEAELSGRIESVFNPAGGSVSVGTIGELILEKDRIDPSKTVINCDKIEKKSDRPEWIS